MIAIVDYGVGNLLSVKNMLKKAGHDSVLASDTDAIVAADRIILPGIGHFDYCMQRFNGSGLRGIVEKKVIADNTPVLGICVGLQMLMEGSEEGIEKGLGWISGQTVRFDSSKLDGQKIPHMGWTEAFNSKSSPLTEGLGEDPRFYFVHSYHVRPDNHDDELLAAHYGYDFTAAVNRNRIYGVQFHPEKSHRFGMKILANFGSMS